MTDSDLIRFLDAQDQIYAQVIEELTSGRKQTHWMWFIFPHVGLGRSAMAQHCGIRDLDQARRYLGDSILGPRLRQVVKLMIDQKRKSAFEILGSPDDIKFRSCLTFVKRPPKIQPDPKWLSGYSHERLCYDGRELHCKRACPPSWHNQEGK
jgi:uncharacterized protein (DUF1810 family)